jgi:competence protein ComEA
MPDLQMPRRTMLLGALVLALTLLVASRFLRPAGTATYAPAPRTQTAHVAAPLVVDVVGAVRRPGLYRLRQGARIADAIARAGGATRRAQLSLVNLAAPLADGVQIVVPARVTGGAGAATAAQPSGPVHLNTATLEDLDALPGVGPVTTELLQYST